MLKFPIDAPKARVIRARAQMNRIELNPDICNGKPVVSGTRITVQTVLSYLSAGDAVEDVLAAHPQLRREDVLACLEYERMH